MNKVLTETLNRFAIRHKNVVVYDPLPIFCDEKLNRCLNGNNNFTYFVDSHHLSVQSDVIVANGIMAFLRDQKLLKAYP